MKAAICILLLLSMRFVSFAQVRPGGQVEDTLPHTVVVYKPFINAFNPAINTFQNKQLIPLDLYTQHLSFFCRQELKMEQAHVPVTFRLGSMDQCNYLEQKPGYKIN